MHHLKTDYVMNQTWTDKLLGRCLRGAHIRKVMGPDAGVSESLAEQDIAYNVQTHITCMGDNKIGVHTLNSWMLRRVSRSIRKAHRS